MLRRIALSLSLAAALPATSMAAPEPAQQGLEQVQEQAMQQAREQAGPEQDSYRQKLREIITREDREPEMPQEIDAYVKFMPKTGARELSGSLAVVDSATEYSIDLKAFDRIPVQLSLTTEYIGIDNSTEVKLPTALTGISTGFQVTLPFPWTDKAYLRLRTAPAIYGENWHASSSSFRIPSQVFGIYQPNEQWTFILGVAVYPDFETKVVPIAGAIYIPNDKWAFNIVPPRPTVSYFLNDKITLFLEGEINAGEFQVNKDGDKKAIVAYDAMNLGTGITYDFNQNVHASFSLGGVFNRKFQYRESLGKVNIKDGLYSQLRMEVNF